MANSPPDLQDLYNRFLPQILTLMKLKDIELQGENTLEYERVIHQHIAEVMTSESRWRLQSLGEGMEWLNASTPFSLEGDLSNRFIIVDFFTYCCLNCHHVLPILKHIERRYHDNPGIAVIGVHSAKFPNEQSVLRVREYVMQNRIEHAIINDPNKLLWEMLGVICWPTVFIFGPAQHLLFKLTGESEIQKLPFITECIMKYCQLEDIMLNRNPLPVAQGYHTNDQQKSLFFPAGISANKFIVISDTGNHRLVLVARGGEIMGVIGSGVAGLKDGSFEKACFNMPRGTAWPNSSMIYVADTNNHAIRLINLETRLVTTVAIQKPAIVKQEKPCEGQKGYDQIPQTEFISPWDVCIGPEYGKEVHSAKINTLYVAVAGSHQIWSMLMTKDGLPRGACIPFAGNGVEGYRNNCYKYMASFAQPSGIEYSAFNPGFLYVADSESSSIRSICLNTGAVKTLVGGESNSLFNFGDRDGTEVLLQHPLAVCGFAENILLISDTYNHKVKKIDISKKECTTLDLRKSVLIEPSALCYDVEDELCYICDTNHHEIRMMDVKEGGGLLVFFITSPLGHALNRSTSVIIYDQESCDDVMLIPEIQAATNGEVFLFFEVIGGRNLIIDDRVPQPYEIEVSGLQMHITCHSNKLFFKRNPNIDEPSMLLKCKDYAESDRCDFTIKVRLPMCNSNGGFCFQKMARFDFTIKRVDEPKDCYVRLCCIIK